MSKKPSVRFEGFFDDWEQRKFSDLAQRESTFRASSFGLPGVEYEDVVAGEGRLNKDIRLKEVQKTGIVFDGTQVLYGKLRPYLHNWLSPDFQGVAIGDWWVLRPIGIDKNFLFRLIQTKQFDEVANQSSGSKMPRADWNLVSNTEFIIPSSLDEQKQIAATFDDLDTLITLHQRKLEKLVALKAACLDKMFPKRGSKVPELRFAGFSGDWEPKKLGDVAISFDYGLNAAAKEFDGVNKYLRITDIDDSTRVFRDDDLTSPNTDLSSAGNYLLHEGEILFARTGASVGKTYIYKETDGLVFFAGFLIRAKIKSEYDAEFVFQNTLGEAYDRYIQVTSQRSGQPGVNAQEYAEYSFLLPTYSEQKRIGIFLQQIDNLIVLHQRKLGKLQQFKQAMMHNMFV